MEAYVDSVESLMRAVHSEHDLLETLADRLHDEAAARRYLALRRIGASAKHAYRVISAERASSAALMARFLA